VLLLLLGLALIGWWQSPKWPFRHHRVAASLTATSAGCRLPARASVDAPPLQTPVPGGVGPFQLQNAVLTPLAGFSVDARVLSREDYRFGRESDLSPTDLALGWGRMREDAVLGQLDISQGNRWFYYRYNNEPPIPVDEITRSASNMHMIPADAATARALDAVRAGDRVRVDGWLVQADSPDGWHWRSSTSRDDTGSGACEVVYVCSLTRL